MSPLASGVLAHLLQGQVMELGRLWDSGHRSLCQERGNATKEELSSEQREGLHVLSATEIAQTHTTLIHSLTTPQQTGLPKQSPPDAPRALRYSQEDEEEPQTHPAACEHLVQASARSS